MSRSCHRATFSSGGAQVAPQHPGQPGELLGLHRVALVGHGRGALLGSLAERLRRLAELGALQVADLGGERFDGGARRRAGVERTRRGGRGPGPGWRAPAAARAARRRSASMLRVDVGVGADRARTACRPPRRRGPCPAAPGRGGPGAPTGPAWPPWWSARRGCRGCARPSGMSRGLGARAVMASSRSMAASMSSAAARVRVRDRAVSTTSRGSQAVVDPGAGRLADPLGDDVDEGGHVVVGDPLPLLDGAATSKPAVGSRTAAASSAGRPRARPRLPRPGSRPRARCELGLVAPEGRHVGQGVTGDQRRLRRPPAAMSVRCCRPGHEIRAAAS